MKLKKKKCMIGYRKDKHEPRTESHLNNDKKNTGIETSYTLLCEYDLVTDISLLFLMKYTMKGYCFRCCYENMNK